MESVTIWLTDQDADNYPFPHQIGERLRSPAKNLEGIVRNAKYAGTEDGKSAWINRRRGIVEPQSYKQIVDAIDDYIGKYEFKKSEWYIGITSEPNDRLFKGHKVKSDGAWICKMAKTSKIARAIEQEYIAKGYDGGDGGGDDDSTYVYAFVKLPGTVR